MQQELGRNNGVAYHAFRLAKYVFRLGPLRGFSAWFTLLVTRRDIVAIPALSSGARVWVRPGTSDVDTFEKVFISHEYDLSAFQSDPKVIVDVGANVGYAAVFFGSRYPAAKVIAVEPEATNFGLLERNTASLGNVSAIRGALWSRDATLKIENPTAESWAFRVVEAGPGSGGDGIRGVTMDDILGGAAHLEIDILKIDIEGSEEEVFRLAPAWLERVRVLVIELHDWLRPGCGTSFFAATSKSPFSYFTQGENVVLVRTDGPRPETI